jgi:hypothetical protein
MCSRAVLPDELVLAHSGPWRLAFLAAAGWSPGRARYVTCHHVEPHGPAGCLRCRRRPDVGARRRPVAASGQAQAALNHLQPAPVNLFNNSNICPGPVVPRRTRHPTASPGRPDHPTPALSRHARKHRFVPRGIAVKPSPAAAQPTTPLRPAPPHPDYTTTISPWRLEDPPAVAA